ncbi:Uu.00g085500.m01.CDS01 [Anthostomella pinea]|uniref:Very-long-chain (3R)-3-hydroxyacyl-CoA dehydratase n=1 Tax=Anthostomella pinea TaxID=933095 RepID=A0AAI8YHE3_9PEZI|nr:Uu.00g085500.m01.CDS01 [Anthostomella pinea]
MAGEHAYLLSYNTISLCLWSYLTCRTLATLASPNTRPGLHDLYPDFLFPWLVVAQSLAALEVLHAASGLVRASPWTTAIQVGGKNLVVWTVMVQFPDIVNGLDGRVGFVGCLVAWGLSEMVRYGFFVVLLARGEAPAWLKWLR